MSCEVIGLNVMKSSIAAEQSLLSGGNHTHSLFGIPAKQKMHCHPSIEAANCIRNLKMSESACFLLNQIDVFVFQYQDELLYLF